MMAKPWLEKEDALWTQQVAWNTTRDQMIDRWRDVNRAHRCAEKCPLIEEAQWFNRVVPRESTLNGAQIAEAILSFGVNPRSLTYAGIASGNRNYIQEAANKGDAMGQYVMCLYASDISEIDVADVWLDKSLSGKYSLAYLEKSLQFDENKTERRLYLEQGIQAGSVRSMIGYGLLSVVPDIQAIYWLGRAWLEDASEAGEFVNVCLAYQFKIVCSRGYYDPQISFIIGFLSSRISEDKIKEMMEDEDLTDFVSFLMTNRDIYLEMCRKTANAIYAWVLVGKKLRVIRDIIGVIAKHIWQTRDQEEWIADEVD